MQTGDSPNIPATPDSDAELRQAGADVEPQASFDSAADEDIVFIPVEEPKTVPGPPNQMQHTFDVVKEEFKRCPVSWSVIGLCVLFYVLLNVAHQDELLVRLTFSPGNGLVFPGLISYMFVHQNIAHIFFNMFMVYMFGTRVERGYGSGPYSIVYFVSGIVAGLAQSLYDPNVYLMGASGAIAGILAVFVRHLPNARLLVFGIVPMPAWMMAALWMAYNLVGAIVGKGDIGYVAHIAGFIAGLALSLIIAPPKRWR